MTELSITGKLQYVGAVETVGAKVTQKRTIVIYVEGQYPKDVAFTLLGQKVTLTDNLHIDQMVKVSFDVSSRQWQDKWFTDVIAWRIEDATQEQPQYAAAQPPVQQASQSTPQMQGQASQPIPQPQPQQPINNEALPF